MTVLKRAGIGAVAAGLMLASVCAASGQANDHEFVSTDPSPLPPKQWASDAAANELKVLEYGRTFLRYHIHIRNKNGDQVRDVIQSKDGAVARLILKEGRPLTAEEDAAERDRLQAMLDSPAAFAKHVKGDASGKKQGADMIKLMPAAMIYTYVPGQPQRSTRTAHEGDVPEIVIDYKPDPQWVPPGMEAEALTGLQGRLWIDAKTRVLMRMEGEVFRPVNFGWGLFAHIYPGGKLSFEQTRVNDQTYLFSSFSEHINVRALMVKTFREDEMTDTSNYSTVAPMSYQDAVKMLLATPLPGH